MPKPFRVPDLMPKMEKLRSEETPVSRMKIEEP